MKEDKIFEVLIGQARVNRWMGSSSKREVWKQCKFEELLPGMVFRVVNDEEHAGKLYRMTGKPVQLSADSEPGFPCEEITPIHRPHSRFTI